MKRTKTSKPNPIKSEILVIQNVRHQREFIAFAHWFATPKMDRDHQTQKEFAKEIGVCQDTLTDWKRHPDFWPLVQKIIGEQMREKIPDVINGLYYNASTNGKASDVKCFLKITGLIDPEN